MCITKQNGWVEIICGSMFSGKSEELIRRVRRATYGHLNVQVFKPSIDDRYANESIVSHSGSSTIAHPIKSPENILNDLDKGIDIIGIDEIQFFDETVIAVVEELAYQGIRVIVSGLDLNFRGEPFGPMPHLMTLAESVTKLNAICPVCGCPASRTQRLINGEPASYYDPTILVGDSEAYEARCRHHHEVPNKPGRRPKDKFTKMMKRSRT